MTPERLRQVEELYHTVRDRPPEDRAQLLAQADPKLRREVESLLAQHCEDGPLDRPALEIAAKLFDDATLTRLTVGEKLGPYKIEALLGVGGMGQVYRARDTRLGRAVAIKISNQQFSARFKTEARAISALNHPHICTLYDAGPNYLVMELVTGETLKGPVPIETALNYARQLAEALEAAHEKAIVHRDLKPANIMVTSDGVIKVLDFGLAKAVDESTPAFDPSKSPTLAPAPTNPGMIMGTAAYMSPEQAMGKPVDNRADIWSFGLVLWELLTGHRLFEGETVSQTLTNVLGGVIDFDKMPPATPAPIRALLRRCLDRNVKNRLRDIGEARVAIDAAFEPVETMLPQAKARAPLPWAVATAFALSLGALAFVHFRQIPPERQHVKFQITPPERRLINFKLSPDGRFLAVVTGIGSTTRTIWIRSLDSLDTRLLTELNGLWPFTFFWSWDGEHVVYQFADKLYKIARTGGPPVLLTDVPSPILGGVWLDSGVILFGTEDGMFRVSSSGGAPVKIYDRHSELPAWLPNSHFLFMRANGVFAGSVDGRMPAQILSDGAVPTYVPPPKPGIPGHLLFVRGQTLLAQSFNAEKLELRGDAIPIVEHVSIIGSARTKAFTVSENGVLVFSPGGSEEVRLAWLDRAGKISQIVSKPFTLPWNPAIRLSPNDSQAIIPIAGENGTDLWIADLKRNTISRFTFNGSQSGVWSPDGRKVLWAANDRKRYLRSADGSGKDELFFENPACDVCYLNDWSSNGKLIAFAERGQKTAFDLWLVPTEGDRKPYLYIQSPFATYWPQISPDSRWMAYGADQPSRPAQIFVESIPAGKGRWQISTEGGDWAIWRRDGQELFYLQDAKLMAVPIRMTETSLEIGKPQMLFEVRAGMRFQVSRDGQRFLVALPIEGISASPPLTVDTDWRAGLMK